MSDISLPAYPPLTAMTVELNNQTEKRAMQSERTSTVVSRSFLEMIWISDDIFRLKIAGRPVAEKWGCPTGRFQLSLKSTLSYPLTAFKTTQIWHLSTGTASLEKIVSVSSPAVSVFIIRAMNVVNYTRCTAITQELPFIVKLKFGQMTSKMMLKWLRKTF